MTTATAAQISFITDLQANRHYLAGITREQWEQQNSHVIQSDAEYAVRTSPEVKALRIEYRQTRDEAVKARLDEKRAEVAAAHIDTMWAEVEAKKAALAVDPTTLTKEQASELIDTLR